MGLFRIKSGQVLKILRQILEIPRMFFDFFHRDAFDWVGLEHPVDEVLHVSRDEVGHVIFALLNFVEESRHTVVIERQTPAHHRE